MRSGACITLVRLGVRDVLCRFAFPLVPALRSTNSATDRSVLFAGFTATMTGSDVPRSCIIGFGSSPSRCGPWGQCAQRSNAGPPRFRRDPFLRDGVFDHGRASAPRITGPHMLPSTLLTGSASANFCLSQDRCVRFAPAVAGDYATLTTGRPLRPTRTGLPPAGSRQLSWRTSNPGPRRRLWIASSLRSSQ